MSRNNSRGRHASRGAFFFVCCAAVLFEGCTIFSSNVSTQESKTIELAPSIGVRNLAPRVGVSAATRGEVLELTLTKVTDCVALKTQRFQLVQIKKTQARRLWLGFGVAVIGIGGGIAFATLGHHLVSRSTAIGTGVGLGVVGSYALIESIVVVARIGTKKRVVRRYTRVRRRRKLACRVTPYARRELRVELGGKLLFSGQTSDQGRLRITLAGQGVPKQSPDSIVLSFAGQGVATLPKAELATAIDRYLWPRAQRRNRKELYVQYLKALPEGPHASIVRARLAEIVWISLRARQVRDRKPYERLCQRYPDTPAAAQARRLLEKMAWVRVRRSPTIAALRAFLRSYPNGTYASQARGRLQKRAWNRILRHPRIQALAQFLREFPESPHQPKARELLATLVRKKLAQKYRQRLRQARSVRELYLLYRSAPPFIQKQIASRARRMKGRESWVVSRAESMINNARASQYKVYICSFNKGVLYYRIRLGLMGGLAMLMGGGRRFVSNTTRATNMLNRLFSRIRGVRYAQMRGYCSKPWYY